MRRRPAQGRVAASGVARALATLVVALLAAAWQTAVADEPLARQAFVQAGVAEGAQAVVAGVTQPWQWQRELASGGALSGYWEASAGRWLSDLEDGGRSGAWVTQLALTPVLRLQPRAWERGFVEGGVGANLLLPLYRSRDKRFSTSFNFGSHVAVGWRFGERRQHEIALRLEHFSNAGIRDPNPGEDFVQLRWAWRL